MKEITPQQLFELYKDTLNKCGIYLLKEDDETIEYNIYEEFDIGVHSFLDIQGLNIYKNSFIDIDKLILSGLLREKFIHLQNTKEWDIDNFRTSEKWMEIMMLSDEIKNLQ